MGYKSDAQRKAVHASKADGGKGAPSKMKKKSAMKMKGDLDKDGKMSRYETARQTAIEKNMKKSPSKMYGKKTPAKMADKKSMAKMADKKSMAKKSKQKVEQDYARNAIADYKAGKKSEANYEKKKALEVAAGESGIMMKKSMSKMKGKDSMAKMSKELRYMPIVDREKSTMSAMGSNKILKHMKGRM